MSHMSRVSKTELKYSLPFFLPINYTAPYVFTDRNKGKLCAKPGHQLKVSAMTYWHQEQVMRQKPNRTLAVVSSQSLLKALAGLTHLYLTAANRYRSDDRPFSTTQANIPVYNGVSHPGLTNARMSHNSTARDRHASQLGTVKYLGGWTSAI